MRRQTIPAILALAAAVVSTAPASDWVREDEQWRQRRIERLRSPDGWLTLVGLYWLDGTPKRFGSAEDNDVLLPEGAPPHVGTFAADFQGVTVTPEAGAVLLGDEPLREARRLRGDDQKDPDVLRVGRLRLTAIRRGVRWGIRAKDPESAVLRDFKGIESWPIDPKWRIDAEWVPYASAKQRMIATAQGTHESMKSPGIAKFQRNGVPVSLEPILEEPDAKEMLFVFKDATAGKTTYGGGRFLYADLPKDGRVVLDFNRAYNPPCAFTAYATCPLPPPGNRMKFAVEAGEKKYGNHDPHGLTGSSGAGR